ncbi:MAG: hypothetical protein KatS3mg019_0921 [Fimbriimonadales bacterium]|nr:MAG: hypothetical protein KatS3mg019_0921 [Fimbriimonadales bacterium]
MKAPPYVGLKAELENRFGELPAAVWARVERAGYVDAYETALDDAEREEVLTLALNLLRRHGVRPRKARSTAGSAYSTEGLSRVITAVQASELEHILNAPAETLTETERALRDAIRSFREQYLPEGLIPPEAIPEWFRAQSAGAVHTHTALLLRPETANAIIEAIQRGEPVVLTPEQVLSVRQSCETLAYGGQVYTVRKGALTVLQACVAQLQQYTQWAESDCIAYLLSGKIPEGLPLRWSIRTNLPANLSFVQVEVPAFFNPETVARIYTQARRSHSSRSRLRGLQESHIALIRFVELYRMKHPKARWRTIAEAWNTECARQGRSEWCMREGMLKRHYNRYVRTLQNLATAGQE